MYAVPDPRSGDQVMAAIEVADVSDFDPAEFAAYLAAQDDLGTKAAPRFVRVSTNLPVTGSNKVLKRELQVRALAVRSSRCSAGWDAVNRSTG